MLLIECYVCIDLELHFLICTSFHVTAADYYVSLSVEVLSTQPPSFSLICRAAFWPATTVTWRKDSVVIEGGVTTSVTRLEYLNVLNITEEGVYSCEVFTASTYRNTTVTQTRNVTSMLQQHIF